MPRLALEILEDRTALSANVFVVNTTADFDSDPATVTLRDAITAANATPNSSESEPDRIEFNIPATDLRHFFYQDDGLPGKVSLNKRTVTTAASDSVPDADPDWPHSWFSMRLAAGSALPWISDVVWINGDTRPGSMVNTNSVESRLGLNTVLKIELDGSLSGDAGFVTDWGASGTTIRGLVIGCFGPSGAGIELQSGSDCTIAGNFIGTDPSGMLAHGNVDGLSSNSGGNRIGGLTPADRNLISGNIGDAIRIGGYRVQGSHVQGNLIGTDRTGRYLLPNYGNAVVLANEGNTVGGAGLGQGNILCGNGEQGIFITGSNNVVQGNFIGTDVTGTRPLPNTMHGVWLLGSSNAIGGSDAAARNVIAANRRSGILIDGTHNTRVQGNFIGIDVTGADLGNGFNPSGARYSGIIIDREAEGNLIGGIGPGAGNRIAYNASDGVLVKSGIDNAVLGNSISDNGVGDNGVGDNGIGIDLQDDGVNPNDLGDSDIGANKLAEFPGADFRRATATSTTIEGVLNSTAGKAFRIEFFASSAADPTGYGEGQRFLGAVQVTTSSDAPFGPTFSTTVSTGEFITATATVVTPGGFGDTSEFGLAIEVPETEPMFSSASGMKYEDMDGNGTRDEGEPGLDGWVIYVDLDGLALAMMASRSRSLRAAGSTRSSASPREPTRSAKNSKHRGFRPRPKADITTSSSSPVTPLRT